jgi:hypothetical protein
MLPVVPSGETRICVFESHRNVTVGGERFEKAFGSRYSDDDGMTWSEPSLARLDGNRTFNGTGVIPIDESQTDAGTIMAGFHHGRIMRGTHGNGSEPFTWQALEYKSDAPRSSAESLVRLDELQVIATGGRDVLAMARTNAGHLWEFRSRDDGASWSGLRSTSLVHPDAPPMVFRLSDGKRLLALHHNRSVMRSVYEPVHSKWLSMPMPTPAQIAVGKANPQSMSDWISRAEVWSSISSDGGANWSPPRLLFANALAETLPTSNANYQCSYIDVFIDHGMLNLIVPHRWQRTVHLRLPEASLEHLLTKDQLRAQLATTEGMPGLEWKRLPDLRTPTAWPRRFAGVSNGALIVAGGANFPGAKPWQGGTKTTTTRRTSRSTPAIRGAAGFKLPRPIAYGVSVTTPQGVVCVGGNDATRTYGDAMLLRWIDGSIQITALPPLPARTRAACGAAVGTSVYVVGGTPASDPLTVDGSNAAWALDLSSPNPVWKSLSPLPGPGRAHCVAAALDGPAFCRQRHPTRER